MKNISLKSKTLSVAVTADRSAQRSFICMRKNPGCLADDCEIVLGKVADNQATSTAHDWMLEERCALWNQQLIRRVGEAREGAWAVNVEQAGLYRISLGR
ncbi:hypothetical protein [Pontiella sulfatireligans]|uniref:Uncharacterized protein n=1 Tax=Pontiella sulfatireligans TaxID=2750658 RepID=A0A6C2UK97_9BACT|nr:hypothetical protein [Pontiella sulfatireligans]VGO20655.1 hypothetical protein SCARR_02721 [Pontiella sulfatireligans]